MNIHYEMPRDDQPYWWLENLSDDPSNPESWEIVYCFKNGTACRRGLFVGPIEAPVNAIVKAEAQ